MCQPECSSEKASLSPSRKHAVVELAVAQAIAPAAACNKVRRLIHVLHAARDGGIHITEQDFLRGRDDGLRARAADAIDGQCRNRHRQPRVNGGLTGGIHFVAGLDDIAHDDSFHLV